MFLKASKIVKFHIYNYLSEPSDKYNFIDIFKFELPNRLAKPVDLVLQGKNPNDYETIGKINNRNAAKLVNISNFDKVVIYAFKNRSFRLLSAIRSRFGEFENNCNLYISSGEDRLIRKLKVGKIKFNKEVFYSFAKNGGKNTKLIKHFFNSKDAIDVFEILAEFGNKGEILRRLKFLKNKKKPFSDFVWASINGAGKKGDPDFVNTLLNFEPEIIPVTALEELNKAIFSGKLGFEFLKENYDYHYVTKNLNDIWTYIIGADESKNWEIFEFCLAKININNYFPLLNRFLIHGKFKYFYAAYIKAPSTLEEINQMMAYCFEKKLYGSAKYLNGLGFNYPNTFLTLNCEITALELGLLDYNHLLTRNRLYEDEELKYLDLKTITENFIKYDKKIKTRFNGYFEFCKICVDIKPKLINVYLLTDTEYEKLIDSAKDINDCVKALGPKRDAITRYFYYTDVGFKNAEKYVACCKKVIEDREKYIRDCLPFSMKSISDLICNYDSPRMLRFLNKKNLMFSSIVYSALCFEAKKVTVYLNKTLGQKFRIMVNIILKDDTAATRKMREFLDLTL